jgi:hypothetical protein
MDIGFIGGVFQSVLLKIFQQVATEKRLDVQAGYLPQLV